jgi:hypothetical protein
MTNQIKTDRCPHCSVVYGSARVMPFRAKDPIARRSADHIVPRYCGGSFSDEDNNRRYMCDRCNAILGNCGACMGALICVLDLERETGISAFKIAAKKIKSPHKKLRKAWAKHRGIPRGGNWMDKLRVKK